MAIFTYPFAKETITVDLGDPPYRLFHDLKLEIVRKLMQGVEYIHLSGVEGHIAEFGTATGLTASSLAMALTKARDLYSSLDHNHRIPGRNLYLFDSFEGLPQATAEPDRRSPHVVSGVWGKGACKALNADQLADMVSRHIESASIRIFEGWYADTLPKIGKDVKFALVHLDCDLFESTFQVLDYLLAHNHFSDGALLFFDDWSCNRGSDHFGQRRAWEECLKKYDLHYDHLGDYGSLSHRILLHFSPIRDSAPALEDRLLRLETELENLAQTHNAERISLIEEMTAQVTRYQHSVVHIEKELMAFKKELGLTKTCESPSPSFSLNTSGTGQANVPEYSDLMKKIDALEKELTSQANRHGIFKKRFQEEMEAFTDNFRTETETIQKELRRLTNLYESNRRIDRQLLESFLENYEKDKARFEKKINDLRKPLKI